MWAGRAGRDATREESQEVERQEQTYEGTA